MERDPMDVVAIIAYRCILRQVYASTSSRMCVRGQFNVFEHDDLKLISRMYNYRARVGLARGVWTRVLHIS